MRLAKIENAAISSFRVCEIYPFNPDAVDYSKCVNSSNVSDKREEPEPVSEAFKVFQETTEELVPGLMKRIEDNHTDPSETKLTQP